MNFVRTPLMTFKLKFGEAFEMPQFTIIDDKTSKIKLESKF